MERTRLVMNSKGMTALRNSPQMQAHLLREAEAMAERAGDGFVADVQPGRTRAHGMVKSTDHASMKAQAERSALTRAIRG